MNNNVKIEVPVPLTMVSDQELIDELNRRERLVKWSRNVLPVPSSLGHKHWSPSCDVEEWDCRRESEK